MNVTSNPKIIPLMPAAAGLLALLFRLGLFRLGTDEKGLLVPGHFLSILTWIMTAAVLLFVLRFVLPGKGSEKYADNFLPSAAAAYGAFALAAAIAVSVFFGWSIARIDLVRNFCGILAVPALVAAGLHRLQGKRPFFGLHGIVCLYLAFHALSHYQSWSSRPQIHDYFFIMLASALLALFAYYQTAFDVGLGSRRLQLGTGLLAGFFCLAALANGQDIPLYLSGAIWTLTNLCSLTPVRRRRQNPAAEPQKEESHESA